MSSTLENKHWSSEMITLFGLWLWKEGEYGHALLCITGPQWGLKIGSQLKITWEDVIYLDDGQTRVELDNPDIDSMFRPIIGLSYEYIEKAFNTVNINYTEDSIYVNYKTGKVLTTSTLNRELQKLSEPFLAELKENTGKELNLKPLKSNAFQIALALKMLEKYHYSKKCLISISKFMGHRTLKDTIKLLEVEPCDTIVYDFNGFSKSSSINTSILENNEELKSFIDKATHDHYTKFIESITI